MMYNSQRFKFFIKDAIIESIFIEINMLGSKNIIIRTIYRPPNNKFEIFENVLNVPNEKNNFIDYRHFLFLQVTRKTRV
jgi:hypothetical protein